jgi:hypothetical protein
MHRGVASRQFIQFSKRGSSRVAVFGEGHDRKRKRRDKAAVEAQKKEAAIKNAVEGSLVCKYTLARANRTALTTTAPLVAPTTR